MHNYIEFFNKMPIWLLVGLMAAFGLMQAIGEILEFKGKVVPEFMKVRKWVARRRKERKATAEMAELMPSLKSVPEALERATALLQSVEVHYNEDNIALRNKWMDGVDSNIGEIRRWMQEMSVKMDKNNEDTLEIRIENMRDTIIDFASYVGKEENAVTREQFNRVFKLYDKYEGILAKNGRTNGEVDIAIRIIQDSYKKHLMSHGFVEDLWEY